MQNHHLCLLECQQSPRPQRESVVFVENSSSTCDTPESVSCVSPSLFLCNLSSRFQKCRFLESSRPVSLLWIIFHDRVNRHMRRKDKEKTDLPVMALGFPVVWATCLWADTLPFICFFSLFFFLISFRNMFLLSGSEICGTSATRTIYCIQWATNCQS